jgi:peptidoglycan/xylan/chitin deacetylase (PgdA/CDA1 family)
MALTFDDLPYATPHLPGELQKAQRVTAAILRILRAHHARALGFVNEQKLQVPNEVDARVALLQAWIAEGSVLGNHTYAHTDLNAVSVEFFEDEIIRGGVVTTRLMQSYGPYQRYFRHPRTHTGDTVEKKTAIEEFLASRGYRIAPHTIDSSDFVFNAVYVASLERRDRATTTKVCSAYQDFVMAATDFAERTAPKVAGHEIPQVILLHANDMNADCLDGILVRLEQRGYHFVTLDEAMADPAYSRKDIFVTQYGPTWLWRWRKRDGQNVSFGDDPEPPKWITKIYEDSLRPSRP